jgi:PAS domain-containing protein
MASSDQADLQGHNRRLRLRIAELEEQLGRFHRPSENVEDSPLVTVIRQLMADAPVGFAFLNTDFRYEVVNRRLAEMNGVPAALHIGRTVEEILPHLAFQTRRAFRKVIATGKPVLDVQFSGETGPYGTGPKAGIR